MSSCKESHVIAVEVGAAGGVLAAGVFVVCHLVGAGDIVVGVERVCGASHFIVGHTVVHCEACPVVGTLTLVEFERERDAQVASGMHHYHVVRVWGDVWVLNSPSLAVGSAGGGCHGSRLRDVVAGLFPVGVQVVVDNGLVGIDCGGYCA